MLNRTKGYYALTGLFVVGILPGAVMNLVQPEVLVTAAETIGVPLALMSLMGIWKLLGVVGLVRPQFTRINEWAYAGFFFDLTGAAYLHAAAGDYAGMPGSLGLLVVLVGSYLLRPAPASSAASATPTSPAAMAPLEAPST